MASSGNIFKEIAAKASILKVIEAELGANRIVKKGNSYVCLCPFHEDHSPSMTIDIRRNTFHCWVDDHKGDPIAFVEQYEHLSPIEALKKVCSICSIPLPSELSNRKEYVPAVEREYPEELKALKELSHFYQLTLSSALGEKGREYLSSRKIPQEVIDHFSIGFAPEDPGEAIRSLRGLGYEVTTLEKAGILVNSSKLTDRYSSRVMFPIEDNYGHVVGFSGRKISSLQEGGKYINYPETDLFHKSEILYHFSKAKETARKDGYIYLVEGFMDVIAFVRAGMNSVVGTMGTALTKEHVSALKSLGVEVRLCLDSDEPGQVGEERCCPILLEAKVPFRVVRPFKTGKDADEVLTNGKEKGKEALEDASKRLYDPFLFLLGRALRKDGVVRNRLSDPLEVQAFLTKASPYYFALDEISRARDLEILSKVSDLSSDVLKDALSQKKIPLQENGSPKQEPRRNYPNRDSYRKWDFHRKEEKEQINYSSMATFSNEREKAASNINGCYELVRSSSQGEGFYPYLLENETNLLISTCLSRTAYLAFEATRNDYSFAPFYLLNNLISLLYVKDSNKTALTRDDYVSLAKSLEESSAPVKKETEEENREESSFSEFFDDEEVTSVDTHTVSKEDQQLLLPLLQKLADLPSSFYDPMGFQRDLKLHTYYCQLDALLRQSKLQDGEKESIETKRKRILLERNIRRNGGKVVSKG